MIRLIALLVVAFLLPFLIHGFLTLVRDRGFRPLPSALRGRIWLVAFGLICSLGTLVSLMGRAPNALGDHYIPAHLEGSVLVPGRFEKAD